MSFLSKKIIEEFFIILKEKPIYKKVLILTWALMPFIMMISKSLTDLFIVVISISFMVFSVIKFSWKWLNSNWVRMAILFFLISIISAYFSHMPSKSISNGIGWIRFPLFAVAISYWLIRDKEVLYFSLFLNFFALILIFFLMGFESLLVNNNTYEWPFRNPLNGPFIHRIGIIFFVFALLILFSDLNYKLTASLFLVLSFFFSLLTGHRVGNFSFIIMLTILCFWPIYNFKRFLIIFLSFCFFLTLYFSFNYDKLDRYLFDIYNLTNSSLLQYIGLWKTGIIVFVDNFFLGIGPTNVQNYLAENLIINFDPYKNSEHPHNHFIQAFAETGFIGGIIYCLMVYHIILKIFKSAEVSTYNTNWPLPQSAFIASICLLWPFANTHDLFGQQQNAFLWYCLSIYLVIAKINFSYSKIK